MKGIISPKVNTAVIAAIQDELDQRQSILDGVTDEAVARKKLSVVRSNQTNDSILVYYNPETNNMYIGWQDVNEPSTPDRTDIQATDGTGVYIRKRVDGTWTTVPQAITIGGTGATNAPAALQNLGIAYKVNDTVTVSNIIAGGWISSATTIIGFTLYPPKLLNSVSTITLTSLKATIRTTAGGYINSVSSEVEYVGASGYTVGATKTGNNAFRVTITKSSAYTNVTNNTPVIVHCTYTAKFT